jgi:hypothetical protein
MAPSAAPDDALIRGQQRQRAGGGHGDVHRWPRHIIMHGTPDERMTKVPNRHRVGRVYSGLIGPVALRRGDEP